MRAEFRIDFQGRREVQTFSGARIQPMGNGVQLSLGIAGQVCPFGQVLAQQPIGILIGAALPGAVRIGKKDLDRKPLGQLLVLGHFFPSIVGQGFAQGRGHMSEFLAEALSGTPRIRPVHSGQNDQTGGPLDQVPTAEPLRAPLSRSPSQWPGTVRVATSAGRAASGVILGICPRRAVPRARGRRALRACLNAASSSLRKEPRGSTYSAA